METNPETFQVGHLAGINKDKFTAGGVLVCDTGLLRLAVNKKMLATCIKHTRILCQIPKYASTTRQT